MFANATPSADISICPILKLVRRGFSFCFTTIKSRKQFAARNSHKGRTVALPFEQFYLTTELSNVVGISFIFVTSFGRYPCRRWQCIFVRKIIRPPITDFDSQITVICNGSVSRPFSFTAAWDSAVYRTISNTVGLQREWRYCDDSFRSHCFVLTFSLLALVKTSGNHLINTSFLDYPSHSFCKRVSFI